ncbi:Replication initiator 1 [Myotis davidii]|uniref:Replication initiator 1 n=1 Tax=Myotis davidii TaxID=225400 RepID=L5MAE6_MYODS|nr:Replication initiator 1 [Myotis davidii]
MAPASCSQTGSCSRGPGGGSSQGSWALAQGLPGSDCPRPGGDAIDRPFQCACCVNRFRHKPNLIAHRCVHTGERPHQCPGCRERFTNKPYWTHTGAPTLVRSPTHALSAGAASATNPTSVSVRSTCVRRVHPERPQRRKPPAFSRSLESSAEPTAQAPVRPAQEPTPEPLLEAPGEVSRDQAEAPLSLCSCDDCGRSFRLERFLWAHQRQHTGSGPSSAPSATWRVHSGERPFACEECGCRFSQGCHLAAHRGDHAPERPFFCPDSGKAFRHKPYRTAHRHIHTSEHPYAYPDGDKSSSQKSNLITHRKSHIRDGAFCCAICGQTFDDEEMLLTHQKKQDI